MNIFEMAEIQLIREKKQHNKNALSMLIDRAVVIRKYLDLQERNRKVAKSRYSK